MDFTTVFGSVAPLMRDRRTSESAARVSWTTSRAFWLVYVVVALGTFTTFSGKAGSCQTGESLRGLLCLPGSLGTLFWQCLVVTSYAAAIIAIYTCSRIRRLYAIPLVLLFGVLIAIDMGFYFAAGRAADLPDIAVLNATSVSDIPVAVQTFSTAVGKSALLTSIVLAPILFRRLTTEHYRHAATFVVPVLLLVGTYGANVMLMATRGFDETFLTSFPPGFSYGFGSAGTAIARAFAKEAPVLEVKSTSRPRFDKIVVVVDESVAHAAFSRFSPTLNTNVVDYGRAMSGANCSAASNFIIRTAGWAGRTSDGGTLNIKRIESLFSLAKRAGYRTAFIDNQHYFRGLGGGNYFGTDETSMIDSVVQLDGEPYARDLSSVTTISELLEAEGRTFVFVNKMGSHVPYRNAIPPELRSHDKDPSSDYLRSVEYGTIQYLERLSRNVDDRTIVFYTSDHGQAFSKKLAHCNTRADVSDPEYLVPLSLITGNASVRDALESNKAAYTDRLSHLEFSESIRNVMGYSVDGVDSVFKEPHNLNTSFCGVWGSPQSLLGIKPRCHVVH
jgi:glucan phosphoethanolaminetransferase (alkaline phosphatase superfamily)